MRRVSWVLIAVGLVLAIFGGYQYYLSQQGQNDAGKEWAANADGERPVPSSLPADSRRQADLKYFNPYKPGETVAKLRVPRLATTLYVVEGTDLKELKKGPGHMPGTALPGVRGNCVIAGHRDTHFRPLANIKNGDEVELETHYGKFLYKVRSMEVVSPTNVASLRPTSDAVLHLITCYPFNYVGHAPKRMVIEAQLENPGTSSPVASGE
jgi:sortase A